MTCIQINLYQSDRDGDMVLLSKNNVEYEKLDDLENDIMNVSGVWYLQMEGIIHITNSGLLEKVCDGVDLERNRYLIQIYEENNKFCYVLNEIREELENEEISEEYFTRYEYLTKSQVDTIIF